MIKKKLWAQTKIIGEKQFLSWQTSLDKGSKKKANYPHFVYKGSWNVDKRWWGGVANFGLKKRS